MLDIWKCELSNLYDLANMRCFAVLPMVMLSSRRRQQAADIYLDLHRSLLLNAEYEWQCDQDHVLNILYTVELQTKVIRRYAKISQSRRRPLLEVESAY